MTGAENHHANGVTIRKLIDETSPGFLSKTYSSDEVYVQTTNHDRTIDSAIAQLEGLYSIPLMWPNADKTFDLNTITDSDNDYLLRLDRDNCDRFD
eukprot:CAMPEP_0170455698 /NCGR_PEP_ID=MMETSP0123-20130129/3571_1 /TAXON_ID=182087 /ORGANISM="Favella ehrenbergii, Strain Fehren 1" /LENGTH=95 /DNA_ID=CAMNT_0010718913 /DNA_START=221 /DNA_END=508 /DNA_ORIENTATION=+